MPISNHDIAMLKNQRFPVSTPKKVTVPGPPGHWPTLLARFPVPRPSPACPERRRRDDDFTATQPENAPKCWGNKSKSAGNLVIFLIYTGQVDFITNGTVGFMVHKVFMCCL